MFHVIIQARMGSSRLPGKVLKSYDNINSLDIIIEKLKNIKEINKIILATTKKKGIIFFTIIVKKKISIFFVAQKIMYLKDFMIVQKFLN